MSNKYDPQEKIKCVKCGREQVAAEMSTKYDYSVSIAGEKPKRYIERLELRCIRCGNLMKRECVDASDA